MPMNWNAGVRQTHRWLSIAFTLAVIANIVLLVMNSSQTWVGVAALVPLIPLLATGLYMFVLPYLGRR
jgi:membrane protein CcdC involved in cytochrome C biogenesis